MTFRPEENIDADLVCALCEYRKAATAHANEYGTIAVSSGLCPNCDDTEPMGVELHRTPELPAESYIDTLIKEAREALATPVPLNAVQSRVRNRRLNRYIDRLSHARNLIGQARRTLEEARRELSG
ncbi:MAG: hypothetical protein OXO53_07075 [Chloroflexota bacterium]|nr:hypothetical protein [Chloroflexota bacterium]